VREKYYFGRKNKPNKMDYKPDEQGHIHHAITDNTPIVHIYTVASKNVLCSWLVVACTNA
jgi:hypothetical protein